MARCFSPRQQGCYHKVVLQLLSVCCLLLLAVQLGYLRRVHVQRVESYNNDIVMSPSPAAADSLGIQDGGRTTLYSNEIPTSSAVQQHGQSVLGRRTTAIRIEDRMIQSVGDIVELNHCSLQNLNASSFFNWAEPIINITLGHFLREAQLKQKSNENVNTTNIGGKQHPKTSTLYDTTKLQIIQDEWMLQLLEMHATQYGLCDFAKYRASIAHTSPVTRNTLKAAGWKLQRVVETVPTSPNSARIAFCIIAHHDVKHLIRLVQAIHMPQHLIVIHLDESTEDEYARHVDEQITRLFDNVVVVQFGTVIYRTDSVSMINLRLMQWMVKELDLDYDYHVTVGGAVFPLYSAPELAQYLYKTNHNVWLGELLHKGMHVHHPQAGVLYNKRLMLSTSTLEAVTESFTSNQNETLIDNVPIPSSIPNVQKWQRRVGFLHGYNNPPGENDNNPNNDTPVVPSWVHRTMQHKSVSGNQAVYATSTVRLLLDNPRVLQLFAMAKYGCCCCIEERVWIAALYLIGLGVEAKARTSMFQVWGGATGRCRGSMNNAVLTRNSSTCFRYEYPPHPFSTNASQHAPRRNQIPDDPQNVAIKNRGATEEYPAGEDKQKSLYFWGNDTLKLLEQAKQDGFLFARKFDSNSDESMRVMQDIVARMHG